MAKARLERSMTEGSPTKLILSFALPIVIGNLFQQFYTMVDTIIVGRRSPGRRWLHGDDHLSHPGLFYGHDGRILRSHQPVLRSAG